MLFVKRLFIAASLTTAALMSAAEPTSTEAATTGTEEIDVKKVSEAFGNFIGRNLKTSGMNFDVDSFLQGIRSGLNGKPSPLSDKDYERQMILLQERAFKKLSEENLKTAETFLQKNAKEKGVVEIEPAKLQYLIVKEGSGADVKDSDSPQIQYTGKYVDGTIFGSSQDTGGPITVPLSQTIPGFSKGLKGMKEGEVRKIFVHPDLGYGKTGHLPPNSLLIFEVELIKANSPDQTGLNTKDDDLTSDNSDQDTDDDSDDEDDEDDED